MDNVDDSENNIFKRNEKYLFSLLYYLTKNIKCPLIFAIIFVIIGDLQNIYFVIHPDIYTNLPDIFKSVLRYMSLDTQNSYLLNIVILSVLILEVIYMCIIFINCIFIKSKNHPIEWSIKILNIMNIPFITILVQPIIHIFFRTMYIKDGVSIYYGDNLLSSRFLVRCILVVVIFVLFVAIQFIGILCFTNISPHYMNNYLIHSHEIPRIMDVLLKTLLTLTITVGNYIHFIEEYQPILTFIFMYFFYKLNNIYSPYYNTLISVVHSAIILFCVGFNTVNVISIMVHFNITVRLIMGLILGGICCIVSPFLWKRNKMNREKNIYKKITKKKKMKLREYGKGKKGDSTNGKNNKDEIIKSNSLSSMRKRKSYNNVEEEEMENESESDEQTTTSGSNESYTDSNSEFSEKKSDDDDDDSDYISFDRKFSSEELYDSIEKIVGTIALREPIIVFSRPCECELISRFIRYNNSIEALNALDDIFNEGIGQYPKNTFLRLSYCILFWYLQGRINQVNDEWGIYNSNDEIYKKKTEKEIKYIERIDEAIQQVNELKPGFLSRYRISYIKSIIEEDKEKQHDYELRKKYEHYKKIKEQSSKYHISTLCYLRDYIEFAYGNDFNDTFYSNYLINIHNLKKLTEQSYATFMQLYPDQNILNNAYNLYLSNVMGDPYEMMKSEMSLSKGNNIMEEKESVVDEDYETFSMKRRESDASNNSRRLSLSSHRIRSSSIDPQALPNNTENIDNYNSSSITKKEENYETFAVKHRQSTGNQRRMSLIPTQLVRANEIKTPRRRISVSTSHNQSHDHNLITENIEKSVTIPEDREIDNEKRTSKNSLQVIDEKNESRESRETLSNIGLDSGDKQRKGSFKSVSEVSSSINREQRKNTAMKKNLSQILLKNTKSNAFLLIVILVLIFIVSSLLEIISFKKIDMVTSFMKNLQIVITFPSIFINISTKTRLLTLYGYYDKKEIYDYYHDQIRQYIDNDLTNTIIPYIEKYKTVKKYNPYFPYITSNEKDKSYKLVVRSVEDSNKISFEHLSVYDISKRISSWADYIADLEYEIWKKPDDDTLITDPSLKIHDFHARFFTDNLKYSLNDIYNSFVDDNIYEIKSNYNYKNISVIFIFLIGANIILLIILYKFGISYSLDSVKRLQLKVFNIYKYLPKEYIDETITKFNKDIDKIAGTINFEMNDSYLSIYDTHCKKNNILFRQKSLTRMILYAYSLICICSVLPLIIISHNVLTEIGYLELMYKRPSAVQLINFFSHESYVGDNESFLQAECEGILKDYIVDLKDNQERIIYSDEFTGIGKIPLLSELHYKKSCKFEDVTKCNNITYFPQYGYTKEVVQLPINELIDEYIRKTEAFVSDHEIMNYSIRHRNNSYSLIGKRNDDLNEEDYLFNSRVLKFQNYTKHHILSGMNRSNQAVINDMSKGIFTMKIIGIALFSINIVLIIILFYYYYFRILAEKEKEIIEIVDILFLLPQSLAKIPQIRDFIEFGNIND